MSPIYRVRVATTGFPGGPGVNTFYFVDINTARDSLHTLFTMFASHYPTSLSAVVESAGDVIEAATGEIVDAWTDPPLAAIAGASPDAYAAPVGILAGWETSTILDGRRIRGHNFIVPQTGPMFEANGSVQEGQLSLYRTGLAAFVTAQSSSFVVWHRPRAAKAADGSRKAVTARVGGIALVTSSRMPDRAAVLRSRRD